MKVLITGAAGFVGKHLISLLKTQHLDIVGTGRNQNEIEALCKMNVAVVQLDIIDFNSLAAALREIRPEYVIHLAAQSSAGASWEDRLGTMEVNIMGTVNLLEAVLQNDINCRVLLVGSAEEYGLIPEKEMPLTEESPLKPVNPYGVSKVISGHLLKLYMRISNNISVLHTRAFNHIGPGQAEGFVLSDFAKQIAEIEKGVMEPVISVGNLSARRDFLDVRDVVRAYWNIIRKGAPGETYNVCSGKHLSIQEILDLLLIEAKVPIEVHVDQSKFRRADIPLLYGDNSKLLELGWEQTITIQQSVEDILAYWRRVV